MITTLAKQLLSDIAQHFSTLPSDAQASLSASMKDSPQLQAMIEAALKRLNLVSRDEFDTQSAVLQRTRMKVEQLEKQILELETTINTPHQ